MILIRSANIIDGSGQPAYKADVLIKDDKISAIGNLATKQAEVVIDGLGYNLAPGFIDVNTDSDHYLSLFTNPQQKDFLIQGVTTIIGGHCGSSLAPLIYGSLESIQKWGDINQVNVNWHTVAEFLKILNQIKLGVNFGTLMGHSTIRRALIGEEMRELTESELKVFKYMIQEGMEDGALGLSTGLSYVHAKSASLDEVQSLVEVVAKHEGVYTTHLRDDRDHLVMSIKEAIEIARNTKVKVLISHLRPLVGFEENFKEGLNLLEQAGRELDIHFDGYPFDTSVVPIYTLLPQWAQDGGAEVMLKNIQSKEKRDRLIKEMVYVAGDLIIARAKEAPHLKGKTLTEFAEVQGLGLPEALLKLMELTNLKSVMFYRNISPDMAIDSLLSSSALVASNGAGLPDKADILKHERFYNTFPKFLEIAQKSDKISLEAAIKKITLTPATKFSLAKRGLVKEGNVADLVMFNKNKIVNVLVNGQLAVRDGQLQETLSGKVLKHRD
ncbi:MAG: amidohydrolase family protein [bacterium]|nr:amidohydrolase family protein [bacterium]